MIKLFILLISSLICLMTAGCMAEPTTVSEQATHPETNKATDSRPKHSEPFEINTETVNVTIPEMQGEIKLAFLSDLHIIVSNDEVGSSEKENVQLRRQIFSDSGIPSEEQFPVWIEVLNNSGPDYVLFGGDLLDFASEANISTLQSGFKKLAQPFMYIRADHDTEPYYLADQDYAKFDRLQQELCEFTDVFIQEFDDFLIIGWNNSTNQLTADGLEKIREALNTEKPTILLTHVPIEPLNDKNLSDECRQTYAGQSLLWGYGKNKDTPNEYTSALLDLIYAEDTQFTEILAGHMHFSWDGNVTPKVHEHVFGPAFYGNMGIVTISE